MNNPKNIEEFNNPENHAMFCEYLLKEITNKAQQSLPIKKLSREYGITRKQVSYVIKKFNPKNRFKRITVNKNMFTQIQQDLFFNYSAYMKEFEDFLVMLEKQKEEQEILNQTNR